MTGVLQTVKPTPASQAAQSNLIPTREKKIGNKPVTPIPQGQASTYSTTQATAAEPQTTAQQSLLSTFSPTSTAAPSTPSVGAIAQPTVTQANVNSVTKPTVGLIANVADANKPSVTETDLSGVSLGEVQAPDLRDSASVASQLNSLLSADNPYIQQARLRAAEQSASRGLRNSTTGIQAGEQAAIASALPIAQQDAQQNFALQQNAILQQYQGDMAKFNAELQAKRDATMQQYGLDQTQYDALVQQVRDLNQQQFTLDQTQYNARLQSLRDATMQQYGLDQSQYDSLVREVEAQNQQSNQLEQLDHSAGLQQQRDQLLAQLQETQATSDHARQMEQIGYSSEMQQQRDQLLAQLQQNQSTVEHAQRMEQMQQEFDNRISGMAVEMGHQNRTNYVNSAAQLRNTAMEQLGYIYSNPEMTASQQASAVANVYTRLERELSNLADVYEPLPGVDFGSTDASSGASGGTSGGTSGGATNPYGDFYPGTGYEIP